MLGYLSGCPDKQTSVDEGCRFESCTNHQSGGSMKSNSWIVVDKATGKAVLETFSQRVADAINRDKYIVKTSHEYLCELNEALNE